MRIGIFAGWIVAVLIAWPQAVSAGAPDIDRDERAVKKYALEDTPDNRWEAKGKGLCVCLEHSVPEYQDKLGMLFFKRVTEALFAEDRNFIRVECLAFSYEMTTGERTSYGPCDKWVPLGK
jgi:hypothetical protein